MEAHKTNEQAQPAKEEEEPILIVRPIIRPGGFLRQLREDFKENLAAWEETYPALMVVVYSSQILGFLTALYGAAVGDEFQALTGFLMNYMGFLMYGRMGITKP
jgi:hypothetical protein